VNWTEDSGFWHEKHYWLTGTRSSTGVCRGGVFTVQIEGGKRNNSGLQIDITGMEGDLKISNPLSFTNPNDNTVEGSQGDNEPLKILPIPDRYNGLPASRLDASVLDLAYLYHAFASNLADNAYHAPDFSDVLFVACHTPSLVSKLPTKRENAVEMPDPARKTDSRISTLKLHIRNGLGGRRQILHRSPRKTLGSAPIRTNSASPPFG